MYYWLHLKYQEVIPHSKIRSGGRYYDGAGLPAKYVLHLPGARSSNLFAMVPRLKGNLDT